ncbi:MAG: metallophosphoesterase [Bacteroidales bacterium]|jgi:hypothetical protein|nr:metallophosphoesterase [Bacteroidales bacterium]
MKKFFFPILFSLFTLILILILTSAFPKNAGFLKIFFFLLLFDAYLWFSIRPGILRMKPVKRLTFYLAYWFPLALILGLTLYGFLVPFITWYQPIRTHITSFILIIYVAKLFPILGLIIADLVRLSRLIYLYLRFGKTKISWPANRKKSLLLTGWVLGVAFFLLLLSGTVFGLYNFQVREQTIPVSDLPPAFDGFRIVQFSDVHLGSWPSMQKLNESVSIINDLRPDVIFFTGDMFNYCTADGKGYEPILANLRAPFGIYAILGNHDYGDYMKWSSTAAKVQNMEDLKTFYKKLGWKLLLNTHDLIKKGSDSIAIIGVENWGALRRFQRNGDIDRAQKGIEKMAVQLLLSHDPSHWDSIISRKYPNIDITFSGHTHGGQFGIDGWGIHWSPAQWLFKQWCGLYAKTTAGGSQFLYVNQGLGSIGYTGRVGINPEITLITLKNK